MTFLQSCLGLLLLATYYHVAYCDAVVFVGADTDDIAREALSLVQRTQHTQAGEELRVIPGLASFNCPGSISSLLFIAGNNTPPDSSITFSLWNPSGSIMGRLLLASPVDSRKVVQKDIELISSSGEDSIALYRATFSPPLEFTSGEMLGIQEGGLALQYAYGQGPENFALVENTTESFTFAGSPVAVRDLPLLIFEKFNCETCDTVCVDSILFDSSDLKQFLQVNTSDKIVTPFLGSPHVSPLLRFTNDGTITRWSASGKLGSEAPPELTIWRANVTSPNTVYNIVQGANSAAVHETVSDTKSFFTQDIAFRVGDVLGVGIFGQQRVVLGEILLSPDNYGASGYDPGDTQTQYESGVIEISLAVDLDSSDENEPVRSIAEPVVYTEALFSDTHSDLEYTALPQFSVPASGRLRRWLFAVQLTPTLRPGQRNLQLQVWREAPNILMQTFSLVHSTNVSSIHHGTTPVISLGVWEIIFEEPLPVEAGDMLGFHQPPTQLRLALMRSGAKTPAHELTLLHAADPFVLTRSTDTSERATPLMAVEIVPGFNPSPSPATSPVITEDDEPLLSQEKTIITAAVSVAVVIVGAVLVGLILLYCCVKLSCCRQTTRIQHEGSLYYTAQKPQSENYISSTVALKSYISTPEPDNGHFTT